MRRSRPRRDGFIHKGLIVVKPKEPMVTVVDDGHNIAGGRKSRAELYGLAIWCQFPIHGVLAI